ncbi:hypothetical protein CEP54_014380, partial [Fusarium duplospermum]
YLTGIVQVIFLPDSSLSEGPLAVRLLRTKRHPRHLKAAYRSIVDTLAHFHPSASADEIMPMLIYTLITLPPENLHVISDVYFVKTFRWELKLTGEAAYCLVNLEAAISFLETMALPTLKADEQLSGLAKSSSSPRSETFPPLSEPEEGPLSIQSA